ncbi:MAG TPA: hypothetical protein VGC42_24665, partial [Kofleriaceae bacterium]
RIAALDDHGNRLVELGSRDVPIVIIGTVAARPSPVPAAPRPAAVAEQPTSRAIYLRWWPYAIGAVAFGGAATYFGLRTRTDADDLRALDRQSANHDFTEAMKLEDRGHRDALLTNIGVGVAGALAITAGVMYFLAPPGHAERRIGAVPVRGGGAIVLGGDL